MKKESSFITKMENLAVEARAAAMQGMWEGIYEILSSITWKEPDFGLYHITLETTKLSVMQYVILQLLFKTYLRRDLFRMDDHDPHAPGGYDQDDEVGILLPGNRLSITILKNVNSREAWADLEARGQGVEYFANHPEEMFQSPDQPAGQ